MGHKPWREIRAKASPEVLEDAERVVARRIRIEQELRERLLADPWVHQRMPPEPLRRIVSTSPSVDHRDSGRRPLRSPTFT